MKIILTGGAGFIGSHILEAYLAQGHEVLVIDNLSTGSKQNLPPEALFVQMDIQDPEIPKVFEEFRPDLLNHQAAQIDVRQSVANPVHDAQINVLGTLNLLQAAQRTPVKKVIFASSGGAIYGEQQEFPASETHPENPMSPYGLTKKIGEEYLKLYQRLYGLPFVVLRYANVYGPRQNPHGEAGVVAIFCQKILEGKTPVIYGDGEQTRDYVYVEDVTQANLLALNEKIEGTFNIGTGRETSVNTLFQILAQVSGQSSVEYAAAKLGEQRRSVISPQNAARTLNWNLKTEFQDGIAKTWQWFERRNRR